jgi:hypothetical protein
MQFAETVSDVVAAGRCLAAAQRAAAESTHQVAAQLRAMSPRAEWIITEQTPDLETLRITWKAWFFFVRALCDKVYGLTLSAAQNKPVQRGGSMTAAIKPGNPVAVILAEEAPEFIPWFVRFRSLRNDVKDGVNFAVTALGSPGLSVTFSTFRISSETGRREVFVDSAGDRKVTLPDVVDDARILAHVLAVVAASAGPRTRK